MPFFTAPGLIVLLCLWAVALVLVTAFARVSMVLSGQRKANEFPANETGDAFHVRANRAHANAVENLPISVGLLICSGILPIEPPFLILANTLLYARIVQSLIHLTSTSILAVNLRFLAFGVQVICYIWMGFILLF